MSDPLIWRIKPLDEGSSQFAFDLSTDNVIAHLIETGYLIPVAIDYEAAAALEHDQWAHWTAYMLDNLGRENISRWRRQIDTPYAELTEKEKDSDREWARKSAAAFGIGETDE